MLKAKCWLLAACVGLIAGEIFCSAAVAESITWKGITWDQDGSGASGYVNSDGNLVVSALPGGENYPAYGSVYHNFVYDSTALTTPWVQFTFLDRLTTGGQVWLQRLNYDVAPEHNTWAQLGTWLYSAHPQYSLFEWNIHDDPSESNGMFVDGLGPTRTAGAHTLRLALNASGQLEYSLDGSLIYRDTSKFVTPDFFGDIWLAARATGADNSIVFTDFQTNIPAPPPIGHPAPGSSAPEPGTFVLLAAGSLSGLAAIWIRRRRRPRQ